MAFAADAPAAPAAPGGASAAQQAVDVVNQAAKDANAFKFDFGVPSSPALSLLGVDQQKVTQSNSLRPFVLSLPSLVSGDQAGQAAAIDIVPAAYLIPASQQTYDTYGPRSLLFHTRAQVGLYNGVSDKDPTKQKPSRATIGISTSFLNTNDPLLAPFPGGGESAWVSCYDSALSDIRKAVPPPPTPDGDRDLTAQLETLDDSIQKLSAAAAVPNLAPNLKQGLEDSIATARTQYQKIDSQQKTLRKTAYDKAAKTYGASSAAQLLPECVKVANRAASLGAALDFGVGAVWNGVPGKIDGLEHANTALWASYRRSIGVRGPAGSTFLDYKDWYDNLDQWFMIGLSGRVGFDEVVATGDKTTPQIIANTYTVWLGLERYTKVDRLAAQYGVERTDPRLAAAKAFGGSRSRYLITYDRKLNDDGLWMTASYGEANGSGALKDDKTAKVTFTFTSPDAPKIFGAP
jgi:hypothetical protein